MYKFSYSHEFSHLCTYETSRLPKPAMASPKFNTSVPIFPMTLTSAILLCWSGPPYFSPPSPAIENASLIRALADAITYKRKVPLPEWKTSQYNGDPLQWHEWYDQHESAIDSQSPTDNIKLTFLKTFVTSRAKLAKAEFAYCGAKYKDASWYREHKFGPTQATVKPHMDKLNVFLALKMHNSDNLINYSWCIWTPVGFFKSFSYDSYLKNDALLHTAVQSLPHNMMHSWSLFTVKWFWIKSIL